MKVYVLNYYDEEHSGIQGIYLSKSKAEQDKLELEQKEIERSFKDLLSYYNQFPCSVMELNQIREEAESSVEYWYDIDETEVVV